MPCNCIPQIVTLNFILDSIDLQILECLFLLRFLEKKMFNEYRKGTSREFINGI